MEDQNGHAGPSRCPTLAEDERHRGVIPPRDICYVPYESEEAHLPAIMDLCDQELSEPYSIYTFRYFLQEWPSLSFLAYPPLGIDSDGLPCTSSPPPTPIACIICKQESHRGKRSRGYIAMLTVAKRWRRKGIARRLVAIAVEEMIEKGANEIVLETEYDNQPSLTLYTSLGFFKEKRLARFYMNGKDAFRLVLPMANIQHFSLLPPESEAEAEAAREALSTNGHDLCGMIDASLDGMDAGEPPPRLPEEMDMGAMIDGYGDHGRQTDVNQRNGSARELDQAVRINAGLAGIIL